MTLQTDFQSLFSLISFCSSSPEIPAGRRFTSHRVLANRRLVKDINQLNQCEKDLNCLRSCDQSFSCPFVISLALSKSPFLVFLFLAPTLCTIFLSALPLFFSDPQQWRDVSFCLTLLTYSDKCVRRLIEAFRLYASRLHDDIVFSHFMAILAKVRNLVERSSGSGSE